MGWLSVFTQKHIAKGNDAMTDNVAAAEASEVAILVPEVIADPVSVDAVESADTAIPFVGEGAANTLCSCVSVSSFTSELQSLENDIASLEADLLKKLAQKKAILLGENAKVDLDLSVLGTLK